MQPLSNNRIFGEHLSFLPILLISELSIHRELGSGDSDPPPPDYYKCYKFPLQKKVSLGISIRTSTPHPYPAAPKNVDSPIPVLKV